MAFNLFNNMVGNLNRKNAFEEFALVSKSGQKVDKIRKKYGMSNPKMDTERDIEAAARSESRAMQRAGGTGRSSTLLSVRDELGMPDIAAPNRTDIAKLNAPRTSIKMWLDQDAALAKVRTTMIRKGIGDDEQLYDAGLDPDYEYRNAPSTEKVRERVEKKKAKLIKTLLSSQASKSDILKKANLLK